MDSTIFDQLYAEGVISGASYNKIRLKQENTFISVHWEIKTLLWLGILMLSTGLGILVYKNISTIGHQAVLVFIALICAGCFFYCFKNKLPFSFNKVVEPNPFFGYILILACSTFIIFIAYLQYQYNLFGTRYGLATFFPMVLLFFSAYYFDHIGVLSMAIVSLAAWLGITVTPLKILTSNDFNSNTIIFTGLALGLLLILTAFRTRKRNIKKHFEFTYSNFGTHIVLISCIAAMFRFDRVYMAWYFGLMIMTVLFYRKALRDRSFYFVLIVTSYAYIGTSYVVLNLLNRANLNIGSFYIGFLYFIASAVALALFLIRTNRKLKTNDSL